MDQADFGRCVRCFAPLPAGATCQDEWCLADVADRALNDLPAGTVLNGQFRIGRVLGRGGFGITYLAWDDRLQRRAAVKECFPQGLVRRSQDGVTVQPFTSRVAPQFASVRDLFLREARVLARFHEHPAIVKVLSVLDTYGSAYLVMEYLAGGTLKSYLESQPDQRVPFEIALGLLSPVMDALEAVHEQQLLHRDVSPDNIFITDGGRVKLLDFGAARQAAGQQTKSLPVILKEGYAPVEQYSARARQGTWTDVYALGATFYRVITGITPSAALDRMEDDDLAAPSALGVEIEPGAERALMRALSVQGADRPPTIAEFSAALMSGATPVEHREFTPAPPRFSIIETPTHGERVREEEAEPRRASRLALLIAGVATVAATGGGAWYVARSTDVPVQPSGSFAGHVLDKTGRAIERAVVTLRPRGCPSCPERSVQAQNGMFADRVPLGAYVATVTADGYRSDFRDIADADLTGNGTAVDFTLERIVEPPPPPPPPSAVGGTIESRGVPIDPRPSMPKDRPQLAPDLSRVLQIGDVTTGWYAAASSGDEHKICPLASFSVTNNSTTELVNISFRGLFHRGDSSEDWGTASATVAALSPGATRAITLRSGFGYTSPQAGTEMLKNSRFIDSKVEIQAASHQNGWTRLGQFTVARELTGETHAPTTTTIPPPVRVGGSIKPPAKIKDVRPEYPAIAQSARVQGVVIVEAVIDPTGRVSSARVLRSIPLLDAAALDAVQQWEFTPTYLNGVAVPVIMTVTVNFTLE